MGSKDHQNPAEIIEEQIMSDQPSGFPQVILISQKFIKLMLIVPKYLFPSILFSLEGTPELQVEA